LGKTIAEKAKRDGVEANPTQVSQAGTKGRIPSLAQRLPNITDDVGKSFPICPQYDTFISALPAPSRLQAIEI
jgi:hypothetical protein